MDFFFAISSFNANTKREIHSFELHLARITVNQAADTVGKSDGFMQLPLPGRKNVLNGMSLSRGIREQVNNEFIYKVVVEESPQKFKGFCIMNFCQIGKRATFTVSLTKQVQYGMW